MTVHFIDVAVTVTVHFIDVGRALTLVDRHRNPTGFLGPLGIIRGFDELSDAVSRVFEVFVVLSVHLFGLERFHEAFGVTGLR